MNSASSAASARNLWWINPSLQRMTTSTAPIVTIKTSLLAAMGVGNHSEEVNIVSGKQNCHLFLLRLYDSYVFFNSHFREKINMQKNNYQYIYMCKYVWDGLILRFKDLDLVIQGLDRLYEIY